MEKQLKLKQATHKRKIILTSIAVGAVGVLGYFGWQYWKGRKQQDTSTVDIDPIQPVTTNPGPDPYSDIPPTGSGGGKIKIPTNPPIPDRPAPSQFPLKKGSKGDPVKTIQRILNAKFGAALTIDGQMGGKTIAALRKAGLPTSIDESTYNVLAQGIQADGNRIGKDLYSAVLTGNFNKAISLLKQLGNTQDYAAANTQFKAFRINGVRQTIVNAMLHAFSSEGQQQQIKFEFLRIGLQFDGSRWSLSGIGGQPIITVRPSPIWINGRHRVHVPARVVLGNEVSKRLDYTLFVNQGRYFLVPTACIRYLI